MAGIPTPAGMLLDSAGSAIIDVVLGLNVEAISDVRYLPFLFFLSLLIFLYHSLHPLRMSKCGGSGVLPPETMKT